MTDVSWTSTTTTEPHSGRHGDGIVHRVTTSFQSCIGGETFHPIQELFDTEMVLKRRIKSLLSGNSTCELEKMPLKQRRRRHAAPLKGAPLGATIVP